MLFERVNGMYWCIVWWVDIKENKQHDKTIWFVRQAVVKESKQQDIITDEGSMIGIKWWIVKQWLSRTFRLQSINTGGDMRYSLLFNLLIIASNFQRTFHHFLSANNTLRDDASLPPPPPLLPSPLPHPQSTSPSTPMLIPSSTSLDGTSGMPPFADFIDPPTCRKGGTTASKVLSTVPNRLSGNLWMHSSSNTHLQSWRLWSTSHGHPLLHDRRSGLFTIIAFRESLAVMTVILFWHT